MFPRLRVGSLVSVCRVPAIGQRAANSCNSFWSMRWWKATFFEHVLHHPNFSFSFGKGLWQNLRQAPISRYIIDERCVTVDGGSEILFRIGGGRKNLRSLHFASHIGRFKVRLRYTHRLRGNISKFAACNWPASPVIRDPLLERT